MPLDMTTRYPTRRIVYGTYPDPIGRKTANPPTCSPRRGTTGRAARCSAPAAGGLGLITGVVLVPSFGRRLGGIMMAAAPLDVAGERVERRFATYREQLYTRRSRRRPLRT